MVITEYPQKWSAKANSSYALRKPSGALHSTDYKFRGLLHLQRGSHLCYHSWKLTPLTVNRKQDCMCTTESSVPKPLEERNKENREEYLNENQLYPIPTPCLTTCGRKVCPLWMDSALGETILLQKNKNGSFWFGWACTASTQTPSVSSSRKYNKHKNLKHVLTDISTRFYCKKSHRNIAKYLAFKRKCRKN